MSDGKSPVNNKSASSVWYDDGSTSDAATIEAENQSPVRPPRRRCKPLVTTTAGGSPSGLAKRSHSLTTGAMPFVTAAEIKSILKKPVSLTTDDLSPVRSTRTPIALSTASAVTTAGGTCNGTAQKKTKKQVQFDIVSVTNADKCTDDDHGTKTLLATEENTSSLPLTPNVSKQSTHQNPTGKYCPHVSTFIYIKCTIIILD